MMTSTICFVATFAAWLPAAGLGAETILVAGTNSASDAATVNAAIAASPHGAEIVFRGRFLITEPIRLLGYRSYRGESRAGTAFCQADGANLPAVLASAEYLDDTAWTGTPMAIRHLTVDGNRANNPEASTAGLVLRSWLSTVEDLHIANMAGDGLRLTNPGMGGTLLRTSQVNGRIAHCFIENSGRHGICVEDPGNAVTDWNLCDNWIAGSAADGLHLDNAAGWIVQRNHIYGVGQYGIYAHRLFGSSICDNYIEGFGETDRAGDWCGIWGSLQGKVASVIAHNRVFCFGGYKQPESTYRHLALTVNYGAAVVVVTGNAICGAGGAGSIGLDYSCPDGRTLMVVSTGNAVTGVHTAQVVGERVTVSAGY